MGLIFLVIIIIAITFFVMVSANTKFKLGGEFKKVTKNQFSHKIFGEINYQEPLVEIIGPRLDTSVKKVVNAVLIRDFSNTEYKHAVMVLVSDIQVGYLNEEDAIKFIKILKNKHLSEGMGINVKAIIYGEWGDTSKNGNFKVSLNLPKNFEDSVIK